MNDQAYETLKTTAKQQQIIYYQALNNSCGLDLDFNRGCDRREIGNILEEISRFEHERGRPMLSVVVVNQENSSQGNSNMPSIGFFKLARNIRSMRALESKEGFFLRELSKVYNYWKSH
tara:strand:+ start:147 stop:503 length:357 start_codon:yes stop_codon:yes gene_type:complete